MVIKLKRCPWILVIKKMMFYSWLVLVSLLEGARSVCNVDHCDLDYCSGSGCIRCQDGYYLLGTSCYQCQPSCTKCTSSSSCTECERGWHGAACESKCRGECPVCSSFSQCTECIPGRHGSFCQLYCPFGCVDILCDKDTGYCTLGCRDGFYPHGEDCIECPEHCSRCSDNTGCTACVTGYFGQSCESICPESCLNGQCSKELGYCTEGCIDGYYWEETSCVECPDNCVVCEDANTCTHCKTGYWGPRCQKECPFDCIRCDKLGFCIEDPVCNINNCDRGYCFGNGCIKCETGYYLRETECHECPIYCTECSGPSDCTTCVPGRYGSMCENTCRHTCVDCLDFSDCIDCIPGQYGPYCQFYCPLGCINILCHKETGQCTKGCRHGYYQSGEECYQCPEHCTRCSDDSYCTGCVPGYFGAYCQIECPFSCKSNLCDKELGYCVEGCDVGYFDDGRTCVSCSTQCVSCLDKTTCIECKTGYWGPACEFSCPLTCTKCSKEGQCIFDTDCSITHCDTDYCMESSCIKCEAGHYLFGTSCHACPLYCTDCSGPQTCTGCVRGRYGAQCEAPCRDTCLDCISDSQCTECIPGRHGQYCQLYCPLGCVDILCDKDTGQCLDGCRHGYYLSGVDCTDCPEHCTRCYDSNRCTGCIAGYYGTNCQSSCPSSCQNQVCEKTTGLCLEGCIDGYFSQNGDCISCPYTCSTCTELSACVECKTGYWGPQCQHECPMSCLRCASDGQCISDPVCGINKCDTEYCTENSCIKCEDGHYLLGTHCFQCPSRCTKCSGPTSCTECVRGRYGVECEYTCNTACTDCISSSQCTECIPGRHGPFCQFYCPLGCIDIMCEKTSGTCTKGCRHAYFSSQEECVKCPERCEKCSGSDHCTSCAPGFYGSMCQNVCPTSCLNQVCDHVTGNCSEGCVDGYYQSESNCARCPHWCESCLDINICTACKTGRWGRQCQYDCPHACSSCSDQGVCIDDDRTCAIDHCEREYCFGSGCIKCKDGFYLSGTHCYKCQDNCLKCSGPSSCLQCTRGRYGPECEYTCSGLCPDCISSLECLECIPGRYGTTCQSYCPLGCNNILCDKDTGQCIDGCRQGYYFRGGNCMECRERCITCSDESHCNLCTPGSYGSFCQRNCPQGCNDEVCHKETGHCIKGCSKGYFFSEYCQICPERCTSCIDETSCDECKAGYWGPQCQYHCSDQCYSCNSFGQCIDDTGPLCLIANCNKDYCLGNGCTKCESKYYLYGTGCFECPPECQECSSTSVCTLCNQGKYGTTCEFTCESACIECTSSDQCTECIPGRHGSMCHLYCPLGCKDIKCEQATGRCTEGCRTGYYESDGFCIKCRDQCTICTNNSYCIACNPGLYGSTCELACHGGCMDGLCHKETGNCTHGCAADYHYHHGYCVEDNAAGRDCQVNHCTSNNCFGRFCTMCQEGYFLEEFQCLKCPEQCIGCNSNQQCKECRHGRHGSLCQFDCSSGCRNSTCSKQSGFCTEGCKNGYILLQGNCQSCPPNCTSCKSMDICSECDIGYWGTKCQYKCQGCRATGCQQIASCSTGCQDGFHVHITGDENYECLQCPEGCESCSNSSVCELCKAGFWGSTCNISCSPNCKDNLCTQDKGYCRKGCKDGNYGHSCSESCSIRCQTCESRDECLVCATGRYGAMCEQQCSEYCFRYNCFRDNGTCVHGCSVGYTGDMCKEENGPTSCQTAGDSNGASIGLGIVLALAMVVIGALLFLLITRRQSRPKGNDQAPAMMNKTYDTRIGTADFYTPEKKRSGPYDNPRVQPNTISHYPSSSNGDFDKQYDEETEYSMIKTSNDNLACF